MVSNVELELCKEESSQRDEFPCDRDMFELCLILIDENNWSIPKDAYDAVTLYKLLRDEILMHI